MLLVFQGVMDTFGIESDSFTENISPFKEFRKELIINLKYLRKQDIFFGELELLDLYLYTYFVRNKVH